MAQTIHCLLQGVVEHGTGTSAAISGVDVAGKTGTTNNYGDAWFVGWTPQMTTAVWVGFPNQLVPMTTLFNGGPVEGGTFPALIWRAFMTSALQIMASEQAASHHGNSSSASSTTSGYTTAAPSSGGGTASQSQSSPPASGSGATPAPGGNVPDARLRAIRRRAAAGPAHPAGVVAVAVALAARAEARAQAAGPAAPGSAAASSAPASTGTRFRPHRSARGARPRA